MGHRGGQSKLHDALRRGNASECWLAFVDLLDSPTAMEFITAKSFGRLLEVFATDVEASTEEKIRRISTVVESIPMNEERIPNKLIWDLRWSHPSVAWRIFLQMRSSGLQLSRSNCESFLGAIHKEDGADADKYLRTREIYDVVKKSRYVLETPAGTRLIQIVATDEKARFDEALKIFEEMVELGFEPNEYTYSILIRMCGRRRDLDKATTLFRNAQARGVPLNEVLCSTMMHTLAQTGHIGKAFHLLNDIKGAGCQPNVVIYSCLLDACAKYAPHMSEEVLERMQEDGVQLDVIVYNTLIKGCRVSAHCERADFWFNRLLRDGCQPTESTFQTLIGTHIQAKNIRRAEELLEEMMKYGLQPHQKLHYQFVGHYAEIGEFDKALIHMQSASGGSDRRVSGEKSRELLVDGETHSDRFEAAMERLLQSKNYSTGSFNLLLRYCGEKKGLSAMIALFERLKTGGMQPSLGAYSIVIDVLGKKGSASEARTYFEEMVQRGINPDQTVLATLLNAYSHSGLWEDGFEIWRQLRKSGVQVDNSTINVFIDMCGFQNKVDIMERELADLVRSDNVVFNQNVYCSLIEAYARNGKLEKAVLVLFEVMPSRQVVPSVKTAWTLVWMLRKWDHHEAADHSIRELCRIYPHLDGPLSRLNKKTRGKFREHARLTEDRN